MKYKKIMRKTKFIFLIIFPKTLNFMFKSSMLNYYIKYLNDSGLKPHTLAV